MRIQTETEHASLTESKNSDLFLHRELLCSPFRIQLPCQIQEANCWVTDETTLCHREKDFFSLSKDWEKDCFTGTFNLLFICARAPLSCRDNNRRFNKQATTDHRSVGGLNNGTNWPCLKSTWRNHGEMKGTRFITVVFADGGKLREDTVSEKHEFNTHDESHNEVHRSPPGFQLAGTHQNFLFCSHCSAVLSQCLAWLYS